MSDESPKPLPQRPVDRRAALKRLGLAAGAIYVAPALMPLNEAAADDGNGGGYGGGGHGDSGPPWGRPSRPSKPSKPDKKPNSPRD